MTSLQSTLGEGDIADELAATQRQISIAEFFEKNKHMLGFDSGARALVTAVKEAVDNALDATEEAGFLPDIYIEISEEGDYYNLVVEDNGPGITKEQLPKVFGKLLYGSRFHRREQSLTHDQQLLVRRDDEIDLLSIGFLCDAYLPADGGATARIPDEIEVPSFNRETHDLTWQPITHAIRHETDEQTYEITTDKGRSVTLTGNHSLFSLTKTGETKEVKAGELEPGDPILTPRRLPGFEEPKTEINLLNHISLDQLEGRRLYVYGFDEETLREVESGETIRKKPNSESPRQRYYYRYNGVDILKDSLNQYIERGYLPAETVLNLGWEKKAADCELVTYRVGGKETKIPVTLPITTSLMELVAHYISEGHAGDRQIGFTFGSHESDLIGATERAVASVGGSTTTVTRDRNSTRVKAFGSPLAMVLKNWCGDSASNKKIPSFVYESTPELQEHFIAALYQGDGSDSHPGNELDHSTVSETLSRQLSVLWNMQGVLASTHEMESEHGYAEGISTVYRTKVYGEDVNLDEVFREKRPTVGQQYKRVPTSLLEDVQVTDVNYQSVPDTIPGLLAAAGIGSDFKHAAVYQGVIEDALAGEYVTKPRYVFNLIEMGLLDRDHQPTDRLRSLWETIQNLHGITETDMCLLSVKEVEETEPPEYVYDISVPGATGYDENFVVVNDGALSVKNSRGQQGIGISAAVLYSQLTSGTPAKITSKTPSQDTANYFELIIDTDENEPEIQVDKTTTWERPHGTRIELTLEANMRARTQLHNYIRQTAVVNPHARIELKEPDAHLKSDRATDQLPKETEEIRPHPHGVELGTVIKMLQATDSYSLSGFLQEEFTRVGKKTADDITDGFRDHFYGREMVYRPPSPGTEPDLEAEIRAAVSNKGKQATKAFANRVVNGDDGIRGIREFERIAHHELADIIETAADRTEAESGTTFGRTVREKARKAAWRGITADLVPTLYTLVDEATTSRKDDATVEGIAERLSSRFESIDDTRHRLTEDTLSSYVDWAADRVEGESDEAFGETSRENVIEAIWSAMRTVPDDPPKTKDLANDRDAAAALLSGMRDVDVMAPPTDCLSPITDELILEGLKKEFDADFYAAETRDAEVHGGDPFIVEAGIAYGGDLEDEGSADLLRFANRVPLVYQQGACAITDVVRDIGWRNYGLDQPGGSGMPQGPAVIMVHVASTNVPFTSESKDALANIPAIEHEVELAIRGAARDLKSFLNKRRSLEKRRQKQDVIARILPRMAEKLASVTERENLDIDDSLARIMNNVLVDRVVEDGRVKVIVENHSETRADIEVTEIVSAQPSVRDGASVVDMDGEWFIKWSPRVDSGDEAVLEYDLDVGAEDATFDIQVDGLEDAKLTVNA